MNLCTAKKGGDLITDFKKIMASLVVLPRSACIMLTLHMCVVKLPSAHPCFSVVKCSILHRGIPFHVLIYVK